jgi:hypothetical protein
MRWIKKGLIFEPPGQLPWVASHAAVPIPLHLEGNRFRIYFSGRDAGGRTQLSYIEIDIKEPTRVLEWSREPALVVGEAGNFDDSGAMGDWIVRRGSDLHLYYTGWNRGATVPFRNSIGLAISHDGGRTFAKQYDGPLLDRSIHDPCFVSNGCVLAEDTKWRMWYISALRWESKGKALKHYYHLKYAESENGIDWDRKGIVAIDFKNADEHAISRPCVIREDGIYKMWYSYRGETYRIGYAESTDGVSWERKDKLAGIDVSSAGWDSEMIEYPFVFDHGEDRYMLYNGNGYGKTGIGLAILDRGL